MKSTAGMMQAMQIEQEIERRDATALAQRIARLENRMADAMRLLTDHIEIRSQQWGVIEAMQKRFNTLLADAYVGPLPNAIPNPPIDPAEVSRLAKDIREDLDKLCGKAPLEPAEVKRRVEASLTGSQLDELQREMLKPGDIGHVRATTGIIVDEKASEAFTHNQLVRLSAAGILSVAAHTRMILCDEWRFEFANGTFGFEPMRRDAETIVQRVIFLANAQAVDQKARTMQRTINERMSGIIARAAADLARADAYFALADKLNETNTLSKVFPELTALYRALGTPTRPDLAAKEEAKGADPAGGGLFDGD